MFPDAQGGRRQDDGEEVASPCPAEESTSHQMARRFAAPIRTSYRRNPGHGSVLISVFRPGVLCEGASPMPKKSTTKSKDAARTSGDEQPTKEAAPGIRPELLEELLAVAGPGGLTGKDGLLK